MSRPEIQAIREKMDKQVRIREGKRLRKTYYQKKVKDPPEEQSAIGSRIAEVRAEKEKRMRER